MAHALPISRCHSINLEVTRAGSLLGASQLCRLWIAYVSSENTLICEGQLSLTSFHRLYCDFGANGLKNWLAKFERLRRSELEKALVIVVESNPKGYVEHL